jgi:aspartate kinase
MSKPLRVIKFGGTSVGSASCIANVIEIIRAASRDSYVVVVVSAMCGVTNSLIEAATQSEAGNSQAVAAIFEELRKRHNAVAGTLIPSAVERATLIRRLQSVFDQGERLSHHAAVSREVSSAARDSISALGERLCAPLLAAALRRSSMASEAIEATELIVTDAHHGNADPIMSKTRWRCQARLIPLLQQGIIPVVTGFIGATEQGVPTTLGRGGSDYSATILGAALNANEVVIWTDVDGMLTADPRLVAEARTIAEISYQEAPVLACFGAKVLHPKTLRPVMQSGIPLWIRNSFAPEQPGTKITLTGSADCGEAKALSAIGEAAVITLHGPAFIYAHDVIGRALAAATSVRVDVLFTFKSSAQGDINLAFMSPLAKRTVDALQREFAHELAMDGAGLIEVDQNVAIVTAVGRSMIALSGTVERVFAALVREHINLIAIAKGPSECNVSFVIAQKDLSAVLRTAHQELRLGRTDFATSSTPQCLIEDAA